MVLDSSAPHLEDASLGAIRCLHVIITSDAASYSLVFLLFRKVRSRGGDTGLSSGSQCPFSSHKSTIFQCVGAVRLWGLAVGGGKGGVWSWLDSLRSLWNTSQGSFYREFTSLTGVPVSCPWEPAGRFGRSSVSFVSQEGSFPVLVCSCCSSAACGLVSWDASCCARHRCRALGKPSSQALWPLQRPIGESGDHT